MLPVLLACLLNIHIFPPKSHSHPSFSPSGTGRGPVSRPGPRWCPSPPTGDSHVVLLLNRFGRIPMLFFLDSIISYRFTDWDLVMQTCFGFMATRRWRILRWILKFDDKQAFTTQQPRPTLRIGVYLDMGIFGEPRVFGRNLRGPCRHQKTLDDYQSSCQLLTWVLHVDGRLKRTCAQP